MVAERGREMVAERGREMGKVWKKEERKRGGEERTVDIN